MFFEKYSMLLLLGTGIKHLILKIFRYNRR